MYSKNYFLLFLFIAFISIGSITVSAQTTVSGKVEKKSDSKKTPFEGAKIECYRMDVKENCGSTVTDAAGKFSLTVPEKSKVIFAVSGPGIKALAVTNIRMDDSNAFEVEDGDGSVPTEDNVRYVALIAYKEDGKLTAEQKKELEDLEALTSQTLAKNEKIKENNERRAKLVTEGNDAFNQGNFDLAITKFDEGYRLSPELIGSAPNFLNNKAQSLKQRAVVKYNEAVKSKDNALIKQEQVNLVKDFTDALESVTMAHSIVEKSGAANSPANKEVLKFSEKIVKDALKILSQLNLNLSTNNDEETARGIAIFKDLLKIYPKDPDVLSVLGLALFASNAMQESLNYMAFYMDTAPKDHSRREAISGLVTFLTDDQKLKPQKIN